MGKKRTKGKTAQSDESLDMLGMFLQRSLVVQQEKNICFDFKEGLQTL